MATQCRIVQVLSNGKDRLVIETDDIGHYWIRFEEIGGGVYRHIDCNGYDCEPRDMADQIARTYVAKGWAPA